MKKSFILMLALVMVLVSFAGCAGEPTSTPTEKPDGTKEPAPTPGSPGLETLSFSAMVNSRGVDDSTSPAHKAWLTKMEDLMGMKIDIDFKYVPNAEYDDKMKILLTGGDLPDYFLLPFLYNYTDMANEGYFLDFAKYDMPNYMALVDQAKDGRATITMENGMIPGIYQIILPLTGPDNAPDLQNNAMYNYTAFQREGLQIPETLEELYTVAKALKEKYPNSYPVNTNYIGIFPVFYAYQIYANSDGAGTLYWDGDEYTFAGLQDEYKIAVEYLRKLTVEGLFDPEYIIDTVDTIKTKMINEENFVLLNSWRTHASEYTRDSGGETTYVSALTPNAEGRDKAWQSFTRANAVELMGWTIHSANADYEHPEELVKFIDLQFLPEVYEITSWGIEGETYNIVNGEKKFIDEFFQEDDPSKVADKYGLWNDRSGRANPGIRVIQDNYARHASFPIPDYTYFGGKYEEVPVLNTEFFQKLDWPNEYIPPTYNSPAIKLTSEENEETSAILTQLVTYTSQMQADFISGDASMDTWDSFMDTFKNSYDLQRVLDIYNAAAERYFSN